jgi:hypothetical protein
MTADSPGARVLPLDPLALLRALKARRGFGRLKIALPHFELDNAKLGAALVGTAVESHLSVHFYGDFDALAEPVFTTFLEKGLVCYSVWDMQLLPSYPKSYELQIDRGFGSRMSRVLERHAQKLRETEPDPARHAALLKAFTRSPEFRAEMAMEARREPPGRGAKTYVDHVNCYARWRDRHPSPAELAAVRKLSPDHAAASVLALRKQIGDAPRLLLVAATNPKRAAAFRDAAARFGLLVEIEAV